MRRRFTARCGMYSAFSDRYDPEKASSGAFSPTWVLYIIHHNSKKCKPQFFCPRKWGILPPAGIQLLPKYTAVMRGIPHFSLSRRRDDAELAPRVLFILLRRMMLNIILQRIYKGYLVLLGYPDTRLRSRRRVSGLSRRTTRGGYPLWTPRVTDVRRAESFLGFLSLDWDVILRSRRFFCYGIWSANFIGRDIPLTAKYAPNIP